MQWCYVMIYHDLDENPYYAIHEAYLSSDGSITTFTSEPETLKSNNSADLMMLIEDVLHDTNHLDGENIFSISEKQLKAEWAEKSQKADEVISIDWIRSANARFFENQFEEEKTENKEDVNGKNNPKTS